MHPDYCNWTPLTKEENIKKEAADMALMEDIETKVIVRYLECRLLKIHSYYPSRTSAAKALLGACIELLRALRNFSF